MAHNSRLFCQLDFKEIIMEHMAEADKFENETNALFLFVFVCDL